MNTTGNTGSSMFGWLNDTVMGATKKASEAASGAASAVTGAASNAATGVGSMFSPPPQTPNYSGGRRRKSRRARKGKRSKTVRRRKTRGRKLLQTTHPLHDRTKRMAMGRSQAQAQSRSLALSGGRVHAYSANEMSSMQPAYVNSKQGSFLLAGGKRKSKRRKSKKGGQFWN